MTDDEAATLLGIAYDAMDIVAQTKRSLRFRDAHRAILLEIVYFQHRTPEDIQNEFEGKGR